MLLKHYYGMFWKIDSLSSRLLPPGPRLLAIYDDTLQDSSARRTSECESSASGKSPPFLNDNLEDSLQYPSEEGSLACH